METFLKGTTRGELGMTKSYLHLHLALDAQGLDMSTLEAHYTVMDRGLLGGDVCGEQNMVAVSNPCKLDPGLAPEGFVVLHAYCCGNEPYEAWEGKAGEMAQAYYPPSSSASSPLQEGSGFGDSSTSTDISSSSSSRAALKKQYAALKEERAAVLWRSVEKVIPDARKRAVIALVGSPLTHERFLRRPRGTYGATFASVLPDVSTPVQGLVLCGDSVFPGIGVPAVAVNGASAANTLVGPVEHWRKMDELSAAGLM
mmetsp:Transcript_81444/g.162531  ORF Transcript_81444/g.162531 Transcript_81444/m.162531 type:complete len:256 (-) Transcript_81444:133-900(-)